MDQANLGLNCTSGSCACGHITFRTSAPPFEISYCYCHQCAKISGTGFLTFAQFRRSAVVWNREPAVWKSGELSERTMCHLCGSSLSMCYVFEADTISMTMGSLDRIDLPLPTARVHIFLKEKAAWVHVPDDGAARHDFHSINFQKQIDEWKGKTQRDGNTL